MFLNETRRSVNSVDRPGAVSHEPLLGGDLKGCPGREVTRGNSTVAPRSTGWQSPRAVAAFHVYSMAIQTGAMGKLSLRTRGLP